MTYDRALPFPTFNRESEPPDLSFFLEATPDEVAPTQPETVLIEKTLLEATLKKLAELQSWQADYERLKEWERVYLLEPPPSFLMEPNHRIPRLGRNEGAER